MAGNTQVVNVTPQVRTKATVDGKVTIVEIAAHFVTAIQMPEAVNSIAVGDPSLFQVEHSEREPKLVLVKALTEKSAETNLLISGVHGHQISLLLVSQGASAVPAKVDFLLQYKPSGSFLVEPDVVPFPLVGRTTPLAKVQPVTSSTETNSADGQPALIATSLETSASNMPNLPPGPAYGNCEGCESLYVLHLYTKIAKRRAENANLIVARASSDREEGHSIDAQTGSETGAE